MKKFYNKILVLGILLVFSPEILPQATLPPREEMDVNLIKIIKLSRRNQALAEDYQALLGELERVIYDYQNYFAEYDNKNVSENQKTLSQMLYNINIGNYYLELNRLSDDLKKFSSKLTEQEKYFKSNNELKLYRLAKSLQRELDTFDEILHEDISPLFDTQPDSLKKIQSYMIQELENKKYKKNELPSYILLDDIPKIKYEHIEGLAEALKLQKEKIKEYKEILEEHKSSINNNAEYIMVLNNLEKLSKELSKRVMVNIDKNEFTYNNDSELIYFHDLPDLYEIPDVPDVPYINIKEPEPPKVIIIDKDRYFTSESGNIGFTKQSIDSIKVPSEIVPIYINHQTGSIKVTGWEKDFVFVNFETEIRTKEKAKAEKFIDAINIKLFSSNEGVYLNSSFPNIKDPEVKIIQSSMYVKVPINNLVICGNSFGEIEISDLDKGVEVNSNYCQMFLKNIDGTVKALNKMGNTELNNISGKIDIKSSLTPTVVSNCSADMEIQGSNSSIDISNSEGKIKIYNTGNIEINHHEGPVEVENSNGMVTVNDLQGRLTIKNSFQPLFISGVEGEVNIENFNSSIDIKNITGPTTARNRFGSITGESFDGSINLDNQSGNISVIISDYISGNSVINSDLGVVNVFLNEDSDIMLTVSTSGGMIKNIFNNQIKKSDKFIDTKFALGDGSIPLKITGNNSTIIIDEAR